MVNINDFKLLNLKCLSYFDILEKEMGKIIVVPNNKTKERFGFYLYSLESVCNIKDPLDVIRLITDTEFNSILYNIKDNDHGIDAIYIDEENKTFNLFNFEFKEKFKSDNQQSINKITLSLKFINQLISEDINSLKGKLREKAKVIIDKINSNDTWKTRLYYISNDSVPLASTTTEIIQLKKLYDIETISIALDTLSNYMSLRPEGIDCALHLHKDSLIPFSESEISSSVSYVIKLSGAELIRITCDDKTLRENYSIEDLTPLSSVNMEYNLLFDNVRGLIIRSKFNDNIFKTLKSEPSKFFMYNNGLTITAADIISEDTNANKKVKLKIKNFQIVNGGQTIRTLHKFNNLANENISSYLSNCEVLLRVFKITESNILKNKIAEYTNSQNAISNIDLKSLSSEQIQIEQFLDEHEIIYARKTGDTGIPDKEYSHKISMEKFGQILFSLKGFPHKASSEKKQIFDKYYSSIFGEDTFNISVSPDNIKRYFAIKGEYDNNTKGSESSDQKIFYILYLDRFFKSDTKKEIAFLESALKSYETENELSSARKLLQTKFKQYLDEKLNKKFK